MRAVTSKTGGGAAQYAPPDAAGLRQRIEQLDTLPIEDLKAIWIDVWGTPSPKGARWRLLMLGIA